MRKMRSCTSAASARFWVVALALMAAASSSLATADGDGTERMRTRSGSKGKEQIPARVQGDEGERFLSVLSFRPLPCLPILPEEITNMEQKDNKNKDNKRLASIQENSTIVVKEKLFDVHNYKWRKLLDDSSNLKTGNASYITYWSFVPVAVKEKLSFLGFENEPFDLIFRVLTSNLLPLQVIMVGLVLISGPIVYFRQKCLVAIPGAGFVRVPINALRF
ncbi:hypothetical protein ZIOFF_001189 [Zingiber officinale]|uniref:Uncharacterized protein n=1 Tax=Zingiber officinale TaxID=94328 RepID=A0A8J5M768_ZINOF|nr:hypothetical protein ZIOFF_001189 [Zingiber officinale]